MKLYHGFAFSFLTAFSIAATPARVVMQPSKARQTYEGLGCGAML